MIIIIVIDICWLDYVLVGGLSFLWLLDSAFLLSVFGWWGTLFPQFVGLVLEYSGGIY